MGASQWSSERMEKINCPYCEAENEVETSDGVHTDCLNEMQCSSCEKNFVFTAEVSLYLSAEKADCLNGAEHKWKKCSGHPAWFFVGKYRCEDCGETKTEDTPERRKALKEQGDYQPKKDL